MLINFSLPSVVARRLVALLRTTRVAPDTGAQLWIDRLAAHVEGKLKETERIGQADYPPRHPEEVVQEAAEEIHKLTSDLKTFRGMISLHMGPETAKLVRVCVEEHSATWSAHNRAQTNAVVLSLKGQLEKLVSVEPPTGEDITRSLAETNERLYKIAVDKEIDELKEGK